MPGNLPIPSTVVHVWQAVHPFPSRPWAMIGDEDDICNDDNDDDVDGDDDVDCDDFDDNTVII